MREIKFRYRIELEKGIYSFFIFTLPEIEKHKGLEKLQEKIKARDLYTGLKDKNGDEIYEGDIVRNNWWNIYKEFIGNLWIVRFGEYDNSDIEYGSPALGFYGETLKGEQEGINNLPTDYKRDDIEVIGNIYENSELLK